MALGLEIVAHRKQLLPCLLVGALPENGEGTRQKENFPGTHTGAILCFYFQRQDTDNGPITYLRPPAREV